IRRTRDDERTDEEEIPRSKPVLRADLTAALAPCPAGPARPSARRMRWSLTLRLTDTTTANPRSLRFYDDSPTEFSPFSKRRYFTCQHCISISKPLHVIARFLSAWRCTLPRWRRCDQPRDDCSRSDLRAGHIAPATA